MLFAVGHEVSHARQTHLQISCRRCTGGDITVVAIFLQAAAAHVEQAVLPGGLALACSPAALLCLCPCAV